MSEKLWGGRFQKDTDKLVEKFTASLPFDQRLAEEDVKGSLAHVEMLARCSVISAEEAEKISAGLEEIRKEIERGEFPFDLALEDIHMNIEQRLIEKIGSVGGKLHTARSRNDQVALDLHLYLKRELYNIEQLVLGLQEQLLKAAHRYKGVVLPGYTHLQRAQPVLLAHHLLAYFWMLQRDRERMQGVFARTDLMPLGAGALAGTGFPIDREYVAEKLGFGALYENSMDAVSDRDFVLEFFAFASLLMMHLSRLSEELILWSSSEFDFIELDDAYTTGSSIMPQKKNPDVAELGRAKTGRVYGHFFALLTVLKGLPLTYNRDLQEDKEGLFDTIDTLKMLLPLYSGMIETMRVKEKQMGNAVRKDFANATDLADYLVRKGLPFREAHRVVGAMVVYCQEQGILLQDLDLEQCERFHALFTEDIKEVLDPLRVAHARKVRGGTAPCAVEEQMKKAEQALRLIMSKREE
ncbi:MAG: argininosuccinate lyase [Firmicutes bacterium]|nr:argininosuccinate lyase [Bacillota bacterium]